MNNPQEKITCTTALALGRVEAARALGLSVRKLDELVADRDSGIPFAKIGTRVLFPVVELQVWIASQVQKEGGARR